MLITPSAVFPARKARVGEDEEFAVWEFHERLAQKAGITPEMAARYDRHLGDVPDDAVPALPPTYLRRIRRSTCLRIARWTRGFLSSFKISRRVRGSRRGFSCPG